MAQRHEIEAWVLAHRIKPDYANVNGIEELDDDGDWCELA